MRYNYDYWITDYYFRLNISDLANVDINERDGWGETSNTVKSPGCIATKPPCNAVRLLFYKSI
jgi:hypothetical protein